MTTAKIDENEIVILNIRICCPYCQHTERMSFIVNKYYEYSKHGRNKQKPSNQNADMIVGFVQCLNCERPLGAEIIAVSEYALTELLQARNHSINAIDSAIQNSEIYTYPRPLKIKNHQSLPEKIRISFTEIQEDASKGRNAAGIMSVARGCLDVALKKLGQKKGRRVDRISNLANQGVITKDIESWANKLWSDGSDAVHDLEATIEDAREHVEFLKLFFEVVFILPDKISKAKRDTSNTESQP